jgi:hypothetical protein
MLRFDQYESEARFLLDLVKVGVKDREEELIITFIQQGPEVLRSKLGPMGDNDWRQIFDRLVFSGDVLNTCVKNFMPFFKSMIVEHGPGVLREIFDIWDAKYDSVFERLFDLVAVSNGALYDYVYKNRQAFVDMIKDGNCHSLRTCLFLTNSRYESLWKEILQMLCDAVCDTVLNERMSEDSVKALSVILGVLRGQRAIKNQEKD